MALYWLVGFCVFAIINLYLFSVHAPARVLDIYSVPGRWYYLKYCIVYTLISLRKLTGSCFSNKKKQKPGYGISSHESLEDMDKKQPLSKDPKAFDAVYMNGSNRIGWNLLVGLAHRLNNFDGFIILKVPGVGLLLSPKMPDGVLSKDEIEREGDSYSAEGLTLTPLKSMRAWQLLYNGKMRFANNPKKKVNVVLNAMWQSTLKPFNYDTDILTKNMAKALSAEMWTRNYFKMLKDYHQTHYEQFGELTGSVLIDNVEFNINMNTMRDHSFGERREWKGMHRYVLHVFTLANGCCGTIGVLSMPKTFSRLELGYVYNKSDSPTPVSDVDFELYQHGESGIPPTDYSFSFMAGKTLYEMNVSVQDSTELFLGLEWEDVVAALIYIIITLYSWFPYNEYHSMHYIFENTHNGSITQEIYNVILHHFKRRLIFVTWFSVGKVALRILITSPD